MMLYRMIALGAALWTLTSCAHGSLAVRPPITVAPRPEDVQTINEWVTRLVGAYRDNCLVLKILRREADTEVCDPTR